jgi:WD40 repeat protein
LGILTNEKKLISGHSDRHLRIWDLNKSKILSTTPSDSTICQKLVPHGSKYILSGLNDQIKIYDTTTSSVCDTVLKPPGNILDMAVSKGQRSKLIVTEYSIANKSVVLSFMPTRLLDIEEEE